MPEKMKNSSTSTHISSDPTAKYLFKISRNTLRAMVTCTQSSQYAYQSHITKPLIVQQTIQNINAGPQIDGNISNTLQPHNEEAFLNDGTKPERDCRSITEEQKTAVHDSAATSVLVTVSGTAFSCSFSSWL